MSGAIALVMMCFSFIAIKALLSDDGQKRKRQIQTVNLLKPPPPPKVKEKLPEPEIKKKEEVIETPQQEEDPVDDQNADEPPPGDDLGLDADGGAGADGFGLRAKKGARSLIGGNDSGALLRKYAWYTRIIEEELRKQVNSRIEKNGGIPDENLKTVVQIRLDDSGKILDVRIRNSCGDEEMDKVVLESLKTARLSEPPPIGMPRTLKIRISAKG